MESVNLKMTPQAAMAYASIGGDLNEVEIIEDNEPNPLTCPQCGIVKPTGWDTGVVRCADCGTVIARRIEP